MRRALLSLVPTAFVGTGAVIVGMTDSWSRVGVPVGDGNFGDLKVILVAAQCTNVGRWWTLADAPCQPGMSHYNYPSVWANAFGLLNAAPHWTPWVGAMLIAVFVMSLVPLTWLALGASAPVSRALVMSAVAITPPVWLAFQRGNIDQVVFAIVVLAVVLWWIDAGKSSAVAVGVATALKLFPIGASLMFLDARRPRRVPLITLAVTTLLGLAVIARDLPLISARTPQIDGASFGIGLLPLLAANRLGFPVPPSATRLIGLLVFLCAVALIVLLARRSSSRIVCGWTSLCEELQHDAARSAATLGGGGAFLVGYLLGPSYDYRLIFLIPVIAALLSIGTRASAVAVVVLIGQMALSYSIYVGAAEYVSDVMLLGVAPILVVTVARILRPVRTVGA